LSEQQIYPFNSFNVSKRNMIDNNIYSISHDNNGSLGGEGRLPWLLCLAIWFSLSALGWAGLYFAWNLFI